MAFGHAFLAALVLCLLYPKYYTYNAINTSSVHLSCSGTWRRVYLLNLVDGSIKTGCFSTIIVSSSLGWFGSICIAKLDYACGIPRASACFYNDNGIADLFLVIGQQRMRLRIKRKWFIIYYRNCVATFNYLELSIQLSGDVHPLPGPEIGKLIPVQITQQRPTQLTRMFSRNPSNHTQVKITRNLQHSLTAPFQLSLLNVRSIREKGLIVKDFTVEHDLDALIITETWLRPGNVDAIALGTLCPSGYRFLHVPRITETFGGGIGFLFKESLAVNTNVCETFKSFELMDISLKGAKAVRILCVYRPPDESAYALFYEEFSRLLEHILAGWSGDLLIAGDFNFHLDDLNNRHAKRFVDILDGFGLQQHVKGPTHKKGHTLDLIITRSVVGLDDDLVRRLKVRDPCIADHFAVHCELHLQKPRFGKKVVKFRKLRSIDINSFC